MKIDGIHLEEGSKVTNAVIDSGASFPSNPDDGELFYVNDTGGGNTVGLYVYDVDAVGWVRLAKFTDVSSLSSVYQPLDADLTALAALSSTGIAVRTASNTWAQRSVATSGAGLTVSNGDGVSGNPTVSLTNDVAAIEALSGTGLARRTGTDTWSLDTSTYLTANQTITLSGEVTGSGTVAITTTIDKAISPTWTGVHNWGTISPQSTARISVRGRTNAIEFGHSNTAGYGSTLGMGASNGFPFLAFHAEAGTTNNTYRTRGIVGNIISTDAAGTLVIGRATSSNADDQSITRDLTLAGGVMTLLAASGTNLAFNSTAVAIRDINYQTNGVNRWTIRVNGTAEAGSNAGSDFQLVRRDDAGASLGTVFDITRSTGAISLNSSLTTDSAQTTTLRGTNWLYPTAGTAVLRIRAATDTTNDAGWVQWYRANGSTERGWVGFGSNGSDTLSMISQLGAVGIQSASTITLTATGLIHVSANGGGESIRIRGDSAYLSIYNSANSTRRGYIQASTGGDMYVHSEENARRLRLVANGSFVSFSEDNNSTLYNVGYRNVPQVDVTAGRTLGLEDVGKQIRMITNGSQTITIPPAVFSAGDVVTIIAYVGSATHTIARGSGVTLYWAGTNFTDANRTLTHCAIVTITCVASNTFIISGTGIS